MNKSLCLVLATIALTTTAHADVKSCFQNRLPFFQISQLTSASLDEKITGVTNECSDLADDALMTPRSMSEKWVDSASESIVGGLFGHWATNFSKLNGSDLQREYKKQIGEIRKVPSMFERMYRAYGRGELAAVTAIYAAQA